MAAETEMDMTLELAEPMGTLKDEFEGDMDENSDELISSQKSKIFLKLTSGEIRPATVLPFCNFLRGLAAKCKVDLIKMGCARHTQGQDKSTALTKRHRHGEKEPWNKRLKRLKVYQRAFSAIVMHFKAYAPILLHIKKTYEDMLSYRINQIKISHLEKKQLHVKKHIMKLQINSYQFPENSKLLKSEQYLNILRQRITLQEEAINVITGILKKMEEALSDHFERHRDLEEQIIMVNTEITNRRQKAFSMRENEEQQEKDKEAATEDNALAYVDSNAEDVDDPFYNVEDVDDDRRMVWIMAFAICHKDLEDAERKITMYQTKYQYVIPRHEVEGMKRTKTDGRMATVQLTNEKSNLEEELTNLNISEVKLGEELDQVKTQLAELRTTVTPRPSWEQLGEYVLGGVPKWDKMIQGKSTREAAEKLFIEMRSNRAGEKYINFLGVDPPVLRCLRYGKKVPDKRLHYRDAALLIHDIWMARYAVLQQNLHTTKVDDQFEGGGENLAAKSFPDFVAIYFESEYEDIDQRMEWTYNLIECCKRFSLDYRLTQFLSALHSQIDEGVYSATRNELFRVRNVFLEKSVQEGMNDGILFANQYVDALEKAFPTKDDSDLQSLVRVTNKLNAELNSGQNADLGSYRVTQLIDVRDDGFRGPLVSEILKQFEQGRQKLIDKVIGEVAVLIDVSPAVALASKEADPIGDKNVSVIEAYVALTKADSDMNDTMAGAALGWIFASTSVVPGCGISTSRLVNYCKLHRDGTGNPGGEQSMDDDKFERAIKDVIREDDEDIGGKHVAEAQKKNFYEAHKIAKLRTVIKRLKSSSIVPSQQVYDPKSSVLPEGPVDLAKDIEALKQLRKDEPLEDIVVHAPRLSAETEKVEENQEENNPISEEPKD